MVKLRFMRIGKKNRPYFRLCAMESRRQRDGEYLELLGIYDPLIRDEAKSYRFNKERIEYWLSVGAQPSEGVYPFLKKIHVAGLFKAKKPKHVRPERKAKPAPAAGPASTSSTRKPKPPKKAKPPKKPKGEKGGEASAAQG